MEREMRVRLGIAIGLIVIALSLVGYGVFANRNSSYDEYDVAATNTEEQEYQDTGQYTKEDIVGDWTFNWGCYYLSLRDDNTFKMGYIPDMFETSGEKNNVKYNTIYAGDWELKNDYIRFYANRKGGLNRGSNTVWEDIRECDISSMEYEIRKIENEKHLKLSSSDQIGQCYEVMAGYVNLDRIKTFKEICDDADNNLLVKLNRLYKSEEDKEYELINLESRWKKDINSRSSKVRGVNKIRVTDVESQKSVDIEVKSEYDYKGMQRLGNLQRLTMSSEEPMAYSSIYNTEVVKSFIVNDGQSTSLRNFTELVRGKSKLIVP